MALNYQGSELIPGMHPEQETIEAQVWWGRYELQWWAGGVIDSGTLDSGNTGQTSQLRPGLLMGMITSSGKLTQWNPYATDGSQTIKGIFAAHKELDYYGTAKDRYMGSLLVGGGAKADAIIVPGETAAGLSGKNYEFLVREQLKDRFRFDDELSTSYSSSKVKEVTEATAVVAADQNTTFTNPEAAGSVTFTLPAPLPGAKYTFMQVGDQDIVLDGPSTGEFQTAASTAANTVTMAGSVFGTISVEGVRTDSSPSAVYQYKVVADGAVT